MKTQTAQNQSLNFLSCFGDAP